MQFFHVYTNNFLIKNNHYFSQASTVQSWVSNYVSSHFLPVWKLSSWTVNNLKVARLCILTDSKSELHALAGYKSKSYFTREKIKTILQHHCHAFDTSHCGVPWNDKCDRTAKKAATFQHDFKYLSEAYWR